MDDSRRRLRFEKKEVQIYKNENNQQVHSLLDVQHPQQLHHEEKLTRQHKANTKE